MHPVAGEGMARAAFALGEFVLVVREHEIEAAAVDVDRVAEDLLAHGGALNVPAGPTLTPGAVPGRFTRFGAFPQGEVGRGFFPAHRFCPCASEHFFETAAAQLAVIFVFGAAEVDIAVERVGVTLFDQFADHVEHIANMVSGVREVIDGVDAHELQIIEIVVGHLFGEGFDCHALFVGFVDELVVDIGNVDDEGDVIAGVGQVAFDGVEDDGADHVADVSGLIDSGTAEVHFDPAGLNGLKSFLLPRKSAVDAERHRINP